MTDFAARWRGVRIGLTIVGISLWAATPVAAQTDSAAARALFTEGRKLMDAERFEEACPKLEESLRLDQGMGTQFNLAHCWDKLGRTASAWAMFLDVAAAARAANQPQRETAARERANTLEPKLTRLKLTIADPPEGTKVMRDDQEIGKAAWGTAVPVDPGDHVLSVTAPGKEAWSQEVKVPANSKTFSVTVPALVDLPVAAAQPKEVAPTETVPNDVGSDRGGSDFGGQKVAALVIGGVGVAGLAVGTVFMIQARSDNAEAKKLCKLVVNGKDTCPNQPEDDRHTALVKDVKREQLIGLIGLGVGGAAFLTGTLLYLTASDGHSESAVNVAPTWLGDGWGASVSGSF